MPTVLKTNTFHYDASADVTLHFSFDCYQQSEGFTGTVYARVKSEKFSKHVQWLKNSPIQRQGLKHTGIQPKGMVFLRPLYEEFARDFVREFVRRGPEAVWIELDYTLQEMRSAVSAVSVAANNKCRQMKGYQQLVVGAGVLRLPSAQVRQSPLRDPQKGLVTMVFIDHGPYPQATP